MLVIFMFKQRCIKNRPDSIWITALVNVNYGSGTLPEVSVCDTVQCPPQMRVKAVSSKEESTCEHPPQTQVPCLGQSMVSKIFKCIHVTTADLQSTLNDFFISGFRKCFYYAPESYFSSLLLTLSTLFGLFVVASIKF